MPGEPTIADIGISGFQGYEIMREIRLMRRLSRRPLWLSVAFALALVVWFVVVLAAVFGQMHYVPGH